MKRVLLIMLILIGLFFVIWTSIFGNNRLIAMEITALKYPGRLELQEKDGQIIFEELRDRAELNYRSDSTFPTPWYLLKAISEKESLYYFFAQQIGRAHV